MTTEARLVQRLQSHYGTPAPRRLGVAVSGGSDSLALLHAARASGIEVEAVTVDHGLRPEAAGEARTVADICARLGVPHVTLRWEGWDGKGNLQAEARRTRYGLIADWARGRGLPSVALGHTRDDQAETFLMRLSREAGVDGLATMRRTFERAGQRFDRPFLDVRRADLRAYLTGLDVRWIEDPSNEDEGFDRVRARRALAALDPLGIGADEIFGVTEALRDARDALARAAAEFARAKVTSAGGDLIFDRAALRGQPPEIVRRLLGQGLRFVSGAEYPPRGRALDAVIGAAASGGNTTLHGCRVMVSGMTVRITREHAAVAALSGPTDRPWDGRWRLDGPHAPDLAIRALGEAVSACPDWRATGLPRATLLASPAVWRGETLVAAPLAGFGADWSAHVPGSADFATFLILH